MDEQGQVRRPVLGACAGFGVVAEDGPVGEVEAPLFPPSGGEPDYVVVRTGRLRRRWPVVPAVLVEAVDSRQRLLRVRGTGAEIAALPEHLPLAI